MSTDWFLETGNKVNGNFQGFKSTGLDIFKGQKAVYSDRMLS